MDFINNWSTNLISEIGAGSSQLPVSHAAASRLAAGGRYWMTITDASNSRWEIVELREDLSMNRGMDGTIAQEWAKGSIVYCAVTAGQLTDIFARIAALEASGGGGGIDGALVDVDGLILADQNGAALLHSQQE